MLSRTVIVKLMALLGAGFTSLAAHAEAFVLPPPDVDLVGDVRVVYAKHHETLIDIARQNGVGYNEIIRANVGVDRWIPGEGTPIVLPTRYILPNAPREGLVLNVSEMRLYFYPQPKPGEPPVVITYPVSVGRMDWKTPLGKTTVVRKQVDPQWYPPASIKAEHARDGEILPDMIPGGIPENPLGRFALRLGIPGYLIHGTDEQKSNGIGMRVTHGCVRMFPENIEQLFPLVPEGTVVHIVDQPIKAGWLAERLFLEAHSPLEEEDLNVHITVDDALKVVNPKVKIHGIEIDMTILEMAVEQPSGVPVIIAHM